MSITEDRAEIIDFSNPYMFFKIVSLVNKNFADANGLNSESTKDELATTEGVIFTGLASQVSATIPKEQYGINVLETTSLATAITSVSQGTADVLLMSADPVAAGNKANPNSTIVIWDSFVSSPIGVAVKKGNTELLTDINAFIATMGNEAGLYDVLRTNYDALIRKNLGGRGFDFYITE